MVETPFTFNSLGNQLVGIAHFPSYRNNTSILMCHGFTGNKSENNRLFVETGRALSREGFYLERFDFYGSGDSAGEFHESRISINIQNLIDAIARIRNEGSGHLIVLGISMGAATAILTVKDQPVDGLVLWSTVPDMKELFLSRLNISHEALENVNSVEYDGWLIDKHFYEDAIQYNIQDEFQKLVIPKLVVQGSKDDSVFTQGFEEFRKISAGQTQFEMIANAGHTFETVKHRKEVIQLTKNWLQKNFS